MNRYHNIVFECEYVFKLLIYQKKRQVLQGIENSRKSIALRISRPIITMLIFGLTNQSYAPILVPGPDWFNKLTPMDSLEYNL